jgi:BlaI family penicillinase repressor
MPKRNPSQARSKSRVELPQISEAEWLVMRVIWSQGPATANQVVAALAESAEWKPKTIQTLLSRLVQKRALRFEKQGREYVFHAAVQQDDCVHAASRSLLSRLFDGELAPFVACFVEREKLSAEEIDELKRILDSKKKS